MKLFKCQHCNLLLFFENRNCGRCGHVLGYMPEEKELCALKPASNGLWHGFLCSDKLFKFCANAQYDACNWLIPSNCNEPFCIACRHNRTVPDLSNQNNLVAWRKLEFAKHRLFYTLLCLNLPMPNRTDDPKRGLAFDFLSGPPTGEGKVVIGHDDGIITLALNEADDAEREKRRTALHEPYRTLLGHFRHEIGHYYWDLFVGEHQEDACRALFGDDREDYDAALKRYYNQGAPANWRDNFISAYATSHPGEDFAETWAHYLHIIDCLETSQAYGIEVHPTITSDQKLHARATISPYHSDHFEQLVETWLPLTYAMNAMNRSMGLNDIYPFVLSPPVIRKLVFIHGLVHAPRHNNFEVRTAA